MPRGRRVTKPSYVRIVRRRMTLHIAIDLAKVNPHGVTLVQVLVKGSRRSANG
jgi:hypothetical protein